VSTGIQSHPLNGVALQATTLRDQAFGAIRREILAGRLTPGTRLVEAELAARLGVSRNPVREAITRLEQQGLVVTIPNKGAFIVQPTPEQAHDMFLLRAHLEHLALRLAFARRPPETFVGLAEVVADMLHLARTAQPLNADVRGEFSLLDGAFHTRLIEASASPALLRAWETVAPTNIIFLYDQTRSVSIERTELESMATRHARLLKALRSHDPQIAGRELRKHFMPSARRGTVALSASTMAELDWDQPSVTPPRQS
jgi:DNA-binding GntR family transcriptional regulator